MGVILDFGNELGTLELPDDMTDQQAEEFARTQGSTLRRERIAQRMAQQREETAADDQIENGEPSLREKFDDLRMSIPRAAGSGLGKMVTAAGRYLSQAPLPQDESFDPFIAQENIRRMERTPAEAEAEFEANPLTQAGRELTAASEEEFPVIPGREGTLPVQLGEGLGSVAQLAPAAITGPFAPVTAGLMYGGTAAESAAEDADRVIRQRIAGALAVGDTEAAAELERKRFQTSNVAAAVTAPIGAATEGVLGIGAKTAGRLAGNTAIGGIGARIAAKVASRVGTKLPQQVTKRIVGGIEGLATEAAQEASEQVLSNTAARMVYDPNRDISDGVLESLVVGGLTGGIVGGAIGSDPEAQLAAAAVGDNPNLPLPQTLAAVAQTQPEAEVEAEADAETETETEAARAEAAAQKATDDAMKAADEARRAVTGETELVTDDAGNATVKPVEAVTKPVPAPEPAPVSAATAPVPTESQPITPDAVQEPSPSEGVLREEIPAMGLPQVAERGRATEREVEVQAPQVTPAPAPAPTRTPKPPSPEAQQRKDSQEFDRLLIEAGPEIGWVDNLDALAPQMQTAKQDGTTIAAKLAKAKELGKLRYRAAQALGIDAQNTTLDFKKRAELLPALRTYVAEERQAKALTDAIQPGEGKTGVNTSNLGIGDVLTIAEKPVKVVDVDADSGAITLDGGEQFGRTVIEDGAVIYVGNVEKAPQAEDFPEVEAAAQAAAPVPAVFDAPESVADQNARFAREEAQAKAKAAREKLAELQAKPLTGSVGDIGATDMFDASKNDLFSAPAPKAKLSREERIRLSQRLQQVRQSLKFLNAKNLPGTFGHGPVDHGNVEAKRASLQAEAADLERQLGDAPAPKSATVPFQTEAFRGTPETGPQYAQDGRTFWAPDEATALEYGSKVERRRLEFRNPLRSANWMEAKKQLGLPASASMGNVFDAAERAGHDGIVWAHHGKPEFVQLAFLSPTDKAIAALESPQTTGLFPPAQMQAQVTSQAQAVAEDAALQAEAASNLQQVGEKAVKLLDKLESDINGAAYSDPLFLTQFAKLAIKLARALVKGGMALDKAIRQAIAEARQQMPDAPDNDAVLEANLARAITEVEPVDPSPAMEEDRKFSRGLFNGKYVISEDVTWHERAVNWVDQFGDDLPKALTEATGEKPMGGVTPAQRTYILREIMQRAIAMLRAQRNPYEVGMAKQVLGRAAEVAQANASEAGANLKANDLSKRRYASQAPVLLLFGLIRERLQRLPFPELNSDQLRGWVMAARQAAVQELLKETSKADAVVAREFKREARDLGVVWRDVFNAALSTQRQVQRTITRAIMAHPKLQGLSPEAVTELANLLGKQWNREHAKALKSEFSKFIPLPNVKDKARAKLLRAMPRLVRWANLGILTNEAFRNAVAPEFGVQTLDGALVAQLTAMAQEAQTVGGVNRNRILDQMYKLIQKSGKISKADFFRDYWYGSVLSGVRTQVDNAMGILTGALTSVMLGAKAGTNAPGVAKAYGKGAREAIADFWPILWHGEVWRSSNFNPEQPDSALEGIDRSHNIFVRALATPKYVKRLMTAIDHINGLATQQAVIAYELYRDASPEEAAKTLMPTPADISAAQAQAQAEGTPSNLMNKRVREILQDTIPDEIALSARDIRELVTFTNKPKGIAGGIQRGLDAAQKEFPAFKMLSGTVFSRYALNYANELANYAAPVALYRYFMSAPGRSEGKLGLKLGQTERELLLAKMALGSALGGTAAALFLGDDDDERERAIDITGSFKSLDQKKRNQLLSEGRQPYSIRVGDTYVSYRQMGFGGVLGAIGELRDRQLFSPEKWSQDALSDKVLDAGFAGLFIVKDSSAIAGLTEALGFMNSYKYDVDQITEKAAPRYLARLGGSVVPNILKEVDAWGDPSVFKANSGSEFYIQQVPYLRRELGPGPVLNVLGEPIRVERYPWSRWVKQREDDVAWETLGKLASKGVFLPVPTTTVTVKENGTRRELTPEEQYSYQQKVGHDYRKFVETNAAKLKRMKPLEAADFIDAETTRIRTRIRGEMQGKLRSDRR